MDKPLSLDDFAAMEGQLRSCVEADRRYQRVNDVKCDAIYTAKTYEEFALEHSAMEGQLRSCVEADHRYQRVNDVKCDAFYTAKTYEEFAWVFRDRVAAAHLQPLEKKDFKKKAQGGWNQYAANDRNE